MSQKPIGSGYFATVWGVMFLLSAAAAALPPVRAWVRDLGPGALIGTWCLCAGVTLVAWGVNRIKTGDPSDFRIGQDTISFVFSMLATALALAALFH